MTSFQTLDQRLHDQPPDLSESKFYSRRMSSRISHFFSNSEILPSSSFFFFNIYLSSSSLLFSQVFVWRNRFRIPLVVVHMPFSNAKHGIPIFWKIQVVTSGDKRNGNYEETKCLFKMFRCRMISKYDFFKVFKFKMPMHYFYYKLTEWYKYLKQRYEITHKK